MAKAKVTANTTAKKSTKASSQKTGAKSSAHKKTGAPKHPFMEHVSMEELLGFYKKNMDLMKERQQTVVDLFKRVMQLNNSYMRHNLDDILNYSGHVIQGNHQSAEHKAQLEEAFERSLAHGRSVSEVFVHTTKKVLENYRHTFEDNWKNFQTPS